MNSLYKKKLMKHKMRLNSNCPKKVNMTVIQLTILLNNLFKSLEDSDFVDADLTLDELLRKVNSKVMVDTDILESLLFYSNLLDEKESFSHPDGLTFDQFTDRIMGISFKFDKWFNLIEHAKKPSTKKSKL